MSQPFELEWFGGAAEKHFRKLRPGVDQLPWGTLQPDRYPPELVERARVSWTEAAYNEYCTAAAFTDLLSALLAVRAPVDLVGMASDFVADEMLHVELTSRLAMELGGGAPYIVDFENLSMPVTPNVSALQRANEIVVKLCCVGEVFSVEMLAGCFKRARHPLTRGVLETIVRDEAPHGRFGWLYLDWVADLLDDTERARLAQTALLAIDTYAPLWQRLRSRVSQGVTSEGFELMHIHELGWMESEAYARSARQAILNDVAKPLAERGIVLPEEQLTPLLQIDYPLETSPTPR